MFLSSPLPRGNFPDDTLREPVVLRIPHDPPPPWRLKVERQWNYVLSTGRLRISRARNASRRFGNRKDDFHRSPHRDEHCNLRLRSHTCARIA